MDLNSLGEQFKGRTFGELVLHHVNAQDPQTMVKGLQGTIDKIPDVGAAEVELWINEMSELGNSPFFWRRDCGEVFLETCTLARKNISKCGVVNATDEDVFNMAQIAVLNFAHRAQTDTGFKTLIEKSIGTGASGGAQYATFISVIAALFVGFLQLPGWLLLGLAALALYGMRYDHPASFVSRFSYIKNFVLVIFFLSIIEWLARIASLYTTGYQFIGHVK